MDALVRLALAAKAGEVFGGEDKFLSFPPSHFQITYSPGDLAFAAGVGTPAALSKFQEFSNNANRVIRGMLYDPTEDRLLSEVVRDVLDSGQCAVPAAGAVDDERYQAALALLFEVPTDFPRVSSEAQRVYNRYRDTLQLAQEHYLSRKGTVELGDDLEAKTTWTTIEEPNLRAQIADLEAQWETTGKRSEIEAARQVVHNAEMRNAVLTWQQWRDGYNADIDDRSDLSDIDFAPVTLSPADVFAGDDWQAMTLTEAEIAKLAETADPLLRQSFGSSAGSDIVRLQFEYRSAKLERGWLPKDLFTSRFWRLPDGAAMVSDGQSLSAGLCPAFAVAVVFARNVTVDRRGGSGPPTRLHVRPGALLEAMPLSQMTLSTIAIAPSEAIATPKPDFVTLNRDALVRDHRKKPTGPAFGRTRRFRLGQVLTAHPLTVAIPPATVTPAPTTTTDAVSPDVSILAFICKRVPLSPSPDPSLHWS
jgi:hypothetical protein